MDNDLVPVAVETTPAKKRHAVNYSLAEELFSSISHGVGLVLAIIGMVLAILQAAAHGNAQAITAVSVYTASLVILFLASTLYHAITHHEAKAWLRLFDHCAIFLLIAGTYTPFTLISAPADWGWALFGIEWGLAAAGITMKLIGHISPRAKKVGDWSVLLYLAMGWLVLIAPSKLGAGMLEGGFAWLLAGGLLYTFGVVFYLWNRLKFNHAIWHIWVLAAAACHWVAVTYFVIPGGSPLT